MVLLQTTRSACPLQIRYALINNKSTFPYSPHLIPLGMVGAINPPQSGEKTFENFLGNARAFSGTPGVCIALL
jgi:hypothetical protein